MTESEVRGSRTPYCDIRHNIGGERRVSPLWTANLAGRIDAGRKVAAYVQIMDALTRDIEEGRLTSGAYLPASRTLATALDVNRKTVVLAYEALIAQGRLVSAGTRGTMVAMALPRLRLGDAQGGCSSVSHRSPGYDFAPPPTFPRAVADDRGITLDEGAPDARLFPADILARAYRVAARLGSRGDGLHSRDPRGCPTLREGLAAMLRTQRGLVVTAENICITGGSQAGIFLAAQVMIEPGDVVIVEELANAPAVAVFRARGAHILPVRLDDEGLDIEGVEKACREERVRAVLVTPHHQFPTTVALRPERRMRLLELARHYGFAIIEDDYDREFHFARRSLLPMAAYAPDQVIYVGSLARLVLPALRIGYIAAPKAVVDSIAQMAAVVGGSHDALSEDVATELIGNGELRRHARKARIIYEQRRRNFAGSLDELLGELVDYTMPDGGLAFWLRFRRARDLDALEKHAPQMRLRFAASRTFMMGPSAPRGLRLGFASRSESEAHDAIIALRKGVG